MYHHHLWALASGSPRPAGADWKRKAGLAQAEVAILKQQHSDAPEGKPSASVCSRCRAINIVTSLVLLFSFVPVSSSH